MTTQPTEIPTPADDEIFAAACGVLADRIVEHDLIATLHEKTAKKVTHDTGTRRRSQVWWSHHYALDGRRRYTEIADLSGLTANPGILAALENPRAILVVAWVLVVKATP